MDKMAPARRDAMMRGITGFEMQIETLRSTDKASQNRSDTDARSVVAALERLGDIAGAAAIRRTRGW
jgi:transcriptional regulator